MSKKSTTEFLIFALIFSFAFLVVFKPFDVTTYIKTQNLRILYAIIVVAIGVAVLVISRIVMYLLRYKRIYYWKYILWVILELACISIPCNFLAIHVKAGAEEYFELFPRTFFYVSAIMFIPYTVTWLFFALRDKDLLIHRRKLSAKEKEDLDNQVVAMKDLANFYDSRGVLRISIKRENLVYIEGADNYVDICYQNKGRLTKYSLRNSLRIIEEQFADTDFIRCHRSYIINLSRVRIIKKSKQGLFIELDIDGTFDIPLSRTYADAFFQYFSRYSE